jgi:hypothetical protein
MGEAPASESLHAASFFEQNISSIESDGELLEAATLRAAHLQVVACPMVRAK